MARSALPLLLTALLALTACGDPVEVGSAANNDGANNTTGNNDDVSNNDGDNNDDAECVNDADCDAPAEACRVARCQAGACAVEDAAEGAACDDGVACTEDACDGAGTCVGAPNNSACVDDLYCDGLEECVPDDPAADAEGCIDGLTPIAAEDGGICEDPVCSEEAQRVACACEDPGGLCEDDDPTDCVVYRCTEAGLCQAEPLEQGDACDDGVACTEDACDGEGTCVGTPDNTACDDEAFCNGAELCAPDNGDADADGCLPGEPPTDPDGLDCTEDVCDEETDSFTYTTTDACACEEDADCLPAEPLACRVYTCGDDFQCQIDLAEIDAECDDGDMCTSNDICDPEGACMGTFDDTVCDQCTDTTLYADPDEDGWGDDADTDMACLLEGEGREGYVDRGEDCGPTDPWRNPDGWEICGDWVDDDCDEMDAACPETMDSLQVPAWDCQGDPPDNVYAWATFGGGSYEAGSCVLIFQNDTGDFYVAPKATPSGSRVCSSWDERLYAFTLAGATDACPPLELVANFDNNPEDARQAVSTDCRKFLHAMTRGAEVTWLTDVEDAVARRLALFPNLEIACAGYLPPYNTYGWSSKVVQPFQLNMGFVAAE